MIKSFDDKVAEHLQEYNEWKWLKDYIAEYPDCGLKLDDAIAGMKREGQAIKELIEQTKGGKDV
jgi:hypothetical protein